MVSFESASPHSNAIDHPFLVVFICCAALVLLVLMLKFGWEYLNYTWNNRTPYCPPPPPPQQGPPPYYQQGGYFPAQQGYYPAQQDVRMRSPNPY